MTPRYVVAFSVRVNCEDRSINAVFNSWFGDRAVTYRRLYDIPDEWGTAVNVQSMVFGNMGNDSATGVAMTRNSSTGEKKIEGDYLTNAQGEDVVAGIRLTKDISQLKAEMPEVYDEFEQVAHKLENHFNEMQDIEFTVEKGKLWLLQTRDGKRTAQASVRIAVEMVEAAMITKEEAVLRVTPDQVDFFLHPQFDLKEKTSAITAGNLLAGGLNVSPGSASGVVAFDADLAEAWTKEDSREVIMVRPETKPDDVHGMLAAKGILTSRGGRTSHAGSGCRVATIDNATCPFGEGHRAASVRFYVGLQPDTRVLRFRAGRHPTIRARPRSSRPDQGRSTRATSAAHGA